MDLAPLVTKILEKAELSTLDPDWVSRLVAALAARRGRSVPDLENPRSAAFRAALKDTRAFLRDVYGNLWFAPPAVREAALARLIASPTPAHHRALLALHRSTAERLEAYPALYRRLFALTGTPRRLLDLSCGLNPVSWPYLGCRPAYVATELSPKDCGFLNRYFQGLQIPGRAYPRDLAEPACALPWRADVALLFKVADALEAFARGRTFQLLEGLRTRYAIVSFSTKSLGGRPFSVTRGWFARGISARGWDCREITTSAERFFVISLPDKSW